MSCSILKGLNIFLVDISSRKMKLMNLWQNVKKMRDSDGYLSQSFFDIKKDTFYRFSSGPFTQKMFKVIDIQKTKLKF